MVMTGGQTGVDLGALNAALAVGAHCGGWCPANRRNEAGIIASRYPVTPLRVGGYDERTRRNVVEADGTLVLYRLEPEGGTTRTIEICLNACRPLKLIDAERVPIDQAIGQAKAFVNDHRIRRLNVAGPRESKWPGAQDYAFQVVAGLLVDAP